MSRARSSGRDDSGRGSGPMLPLVLSIAAGLPAEAAFQAPFSDEAQVRGIDYRTNQTLNRGQGVAFADLDDDGDPDVVAVGAEDGTAGIFENDGSGTFVDRSATSGIGLLLDTSSVVLADFDSDGDLDIYVGRYNVANVLLRNEGGVVFTDVTSDAGIGDDGNTYGCAWGDYDGDGRPDLYVSNRTIPGQRPGRNRLYHNLGDGAFEEVAAALGVDGGGNTFGVTTAGVDDDGDLDLLVQNHGDALRLFINNHEGEHRQWVKIDVVGEGFSRYALGATVRIR